MHSPEGTAAGAVDGESLLQLAQDIVEVAGLDPIGCVARIAVHGVATPQDGLSRRAHGLDHPWQAVADARVAETVDQRKPAGFVMRMQDIEQPDQAPLRHVRAYFHGDGVVYASEIFHMGSRGISSSYTNPGKVSGKVVPTLAARRLAGLRFLINQVQAFMAGEEIDPFHFPGAHTADAFH